MKELLRSATYAVDAAIWDGETQLPGTLAIVKDNVVFRFKVFSKSHMKLQIPINEIKVVEEFLLYELSRGGLRIVNINGHFDLFVLEDASMFKQKLLEEMVNPK